MTPHAKDEPLPPFSQTSLITPTGRCYEEVIDELVQPWPARMLKVRPGAMNEERTKALALVYYDWREMANRLNRVVGRRGWYAHLVPWGEEKVICSLTILGVPKDSIGEARKEGGRERDNPGTSAEAQAKRRAMAEHGLNYLYFLPQIWGAYDAKRKRFVDPSALIEQIYRTARIADLDLLPYLAPIRDLARSTQRRAPLVTEEQRRQLEDLCAVLGRKEPDYQTLDQVAAQVLLEQCNQAYHARSRS